MTVDMAQEALFAGLVFGVALAAAVVLAGRGRREHSVAGGWTTRTSPSTLSRTADSPAAWTAAFVAVALAFGGAGVLFVAGGDVPAELAAVGGAFLLAAAVLVFGLYVFYGTFVSARGRGLKNAQAALLGVCALGSLFVLAVTLKLLGAF
ncbi:hypothetical protein NDI76_09385 [Halogeometricum sp. S1BR25-6]|uniref:Uncharacterized protein n=1 Tax=Halogeometricum salsisoli TaxID=2950536 RepID=A0ABU2GFR7_9EURY|nr:hypothetical protein [Halogeometricum sp. S1BR25-6]MDS0298958.1 hypothetical protein [Halogeometricum sp. S1BR25-6]